MFNAIKTQKALGAVRKLPPDLRAKAYIIGAIRAAIYFCSFILAPPAYLSLRAGSPAELIYTVTAALFIVLFLPFLPRGGPTWNDVLFFAVSAFADFHLHQIWVVCAANIGLGVISIFACKRCFKDIADEYERRNKGGLK